MINLADKKSKRVYWISLFIEGNLAVSFDSLGIEHISQEVLNKIKDKSITRNIFRIQDNDSIMWILLYCFHKIYAFRKNFVKLY